MGFHGPVGYAVLGVKALVRKVQASRVAKAAPADTADQAMPEVRHAAGAQQPEQQTLKQEVSDSTPHDVEQHKPPPRRVWATRTARNSYIGMFMIGFAMALDFTASLMSIQPLYYITGGRERLYGLTFGIYTLSGIIVTPLYGLWSDRRRTFLLPCVLGTFINAIGNLVYAFTLLADRWWVMLIGRAVAGAGSPILVLGSAYISQMTPFEDRTRVLAQYRIAQSMARMLGPFIGYFFLGLPEPKPSSSTGLKLFNWYTISGWVTFFLVLGLAVVFWCIFTDPTEEERRRVLPPMTQTVDEDAQVAERAAFKRFMVVFTLLQFAFAFSVWAFYSNLFALFAGTFHGVQNQSDNWKTFIGTAAGAITGGVIYRKCIRASKQGQERLFWAAAPVLLFVAWMLGINYHGNTTRAPSEAQYYAATVFMAIAVVQGFAASEAYYSKKLTQYHRQVGNRWGLYLAILGVSNALGCFAGPLVAGAVTSIRTPGGTFACDAGGDECCITAARYFVNGCVLYHGIPWNAAMAGVTFVIALLNAAALYAFGSYGVAGQAVPLQTSATHHEHMPGKPDGAAKSPHSSGSSFAQLT